MFTGITGSMVLAAALSCPSTNVINQVPNLEWNQTDKTTLTRAKHVCKTRYAPRGNPCLITFIKYEFNAYRAICGRER
jgi:hypothetical protein